MGVLDSPTDVQAVNKLGGGLPAALGTSGGLKSEPTQAIANSRADDTIGVALATDAIMVGTKEDSNLTALEPAFFSAASIAANTTDGVLLSTPAGTQIRMLSLFVQCGSIATDVTFESNAATDEQLFKVTLAANGGAVLPFSPVGWFQTGVGESLIVTTSNGSVVQVTGVYISVPT